MYADNTATTQSTGIAGLWNRALGTHGWLLFLRQTFITGHTREEIMRRQLRNRTVGDGPSQGPAAGSDAGPGVSNLLPVSVDSGEPISEERRRRGEAPLRATANVERSTVNSGNNLRGHISTAPSAVSSHSSQRVKWTKEMNISIMRAYYRSTKGEEEIEGFRKRMHDEWKTIYPESTFDEQRICGQYNSIMRRGNVFSAAELNQIKQEVIREMRLEHNSPEVLEHNNVNIDNEETQINDQSNHQESGQDEHAVLKCHYEKCKMQFGGIRITDRPRIPKTLGKIHFYNTCRAMDLILSADVQEVSTMEEILNLVHSAALAVCMRVGTPILSEERKPKPTTGSNEKKDITPTWRKRIETKILKARREISHLGEFFKRGEQCSRRVKNSIRCVAKRIGTRMSSRNSEKMLRNEEERLRQRIAALGARIRRYNEAARRRKEETVYSNNQGLFFRQLEQEKSRVQQPPEEDAMVKFWSDIWSTPRMHDEGAYWLREEEENCEDLNQMQTIGITTDDVKAAIKKTHNWKAPGVDGIQNIWWKYFTSTHSVLAKLFQEILKNEQTMPEYMTVGVTHMLVKGEDSRNPKNYRPITCLTTVYKILTSIISTKIYKHLMDNNLLAPEQNGCRKSSRGCKELLVMDEIIAKQVKKKTHNISLGWVDYKKAFDSVPHSWLRRVLAMYKIHPMLIKFLSSCMDRWKTRLTVRAGDSSYTTREIRIRRGIFQGDSLSPLWFCMSVGPLSRMLRQAEFGYLLKKSPNVRVSHQFYMDDLKLYASNRDQLQSQLELVKSFSDTVCMEFGLDKCATVHVRRGHIEGRAEDIQLTGDTVIQSLGTEDSYKYLGVLQLLGTSDSTARISAEKKVVSRVHKICKSSLSSRNKIAAINSWAIPVAAYTFGIINWSDTALQAFDRRIRTILTSYRMHHPRSSIERLYLSRHLGGRGLHSLEVMCRKQEAGLRQYFLAKQGNLHVALCSQDNNYSPLHLNEANYQPRYKGQQQRVDAWKTKALHGRFAAALTSEQVDIKGSTEWLRTSGMFGETEGFLFAIQDQVVSTRAYKRNILGQNIDASCRLCKQTTESIQHISCGCPTLAQKDYLQRHNNVAKVIHQALARKYGFTNTEVPYYKCKPEQVLRNSRARILWDSAINTDRMVEANRPDIVLFDNETSKAIIIDIAIPLDQNIVSTIAEKKRKYQPLAVELKDMYQLEEVEILPVVVSANGLVTKDWNTVRNKLNLENKHMKIMQKAALLGTVNIIRKVLSLQ